MVNNRRNQLRPLAAGGNVEISGNLSAANSIKVWESEWFYVVNTQDYLKNHSLGAIPKGITVLCGASAEPAQVSVAGPSAAYGALVSSMTSGQINVRTGDYVGWYNNAWQTSGWYKITAWA